MSTTVSVVVPNFRRPQRLRRCLESVARARAAAVVSSEVIVVDDGSGDESAALVRAEFPDVRLVELFENRGYPAAVNAGIEASRGEWILTLNNDTVVDASLLDALVTTGQASSNVGAVAAQQRFSHAPDVIYSAGMSLDRHAHAIDRKMGRSVDESEDGPVQVFGACGAAALYRRAMLDDVGQLDEAFRFGLEDADLAWRAQMAGWRCLYAPGAVVYHDLGGTVPHGSELRYFQAGRNRLLLMAKNLDTRELVRHGARIALFDVLYILYGLLVLRTTAPLRGRMAGAGMWREMRRVGAVQRRPFRLPREGSMREALRRRAIWRDTPRPPGPESRAPDAPDRAEAH